MGFYIKNSDNISVDPESNKRGFCYSAALIKQNLSQPRTIDEVLVLEERLKRQVDEMAPNEIKEVTEPSQCNLVRLVGQKSFGTACENALSNRVVDALVKVLYDEVISKNGNIANHNLIIEVTLRQLFRIIYPDSTIGGNSLKRIKESLEGLDGTYYQSDKKDNDYYFEKFLSIKRVVANQSTKEVTFAIELGEIFRFSQIYSLFDSNYFRATCGKSEVVRRLYQYLAQRISMTAHNAKPSSNIKVAETTLMAYCNIDGLNATKFRKQLEEGIDTCISNGLLEKAYIPTERKTKDRMYGFVLNLKFAGN